ncbi:phosphatase PAP2 family protein [Mitsuaria sp. WAJ17]|uniref:phosphatase PAP2 family protein n=1 Tax=Mitsuaria sp. WAJ17 TaxID=2761452 RepID=UPI0016022C67|nr:phosphatase PAP2 family protein [Mitsuaria sp. WAJ17]MBB2487661.1 phosphatase PAP2 family protein [Mitsuaria sp. WAJ17]
MDTPALPSRERPGRGPARPSEATAGWAGNGPLWALLIVLQAWPGGRYGLALALAAMGGLHVALVGLLKAVFARARPFECCEDVRALESRLDCHSVPSGHTLHALAFSLVLTAQDPHWGWLLWPLSLAIGLSRVVLGLHYPSDVLAAALLGLMGGSLCLLVLRQLGG